MYTIKAVLQPPPASTLGDLPDGSLALVLDGEFKGELFFKNVMGLHSISGNRYWPSEYAKKSSFGSYSGPLQDHCQPLVSGDILQIL